jgi:multidrug efflux pump subunit AcrA (membrane-fusion protein)
MIFMRSPSIVFKSALLVALPCLVFSGCKVKQPETPPATASIAPVTRGDLASTLTVAGEFQPYQEVELHAKVSGYIRRINVDIGDRVRNGQVIATLEVPELNAQVAGSQAEVRHSQSEISRAQSGVVANYAALHAAYTRLTEAAKRRPGLVAEQELDDSRAKDQDGHAKVNVAKSALEAAKEQLGVSKADNQRVQSLEDYSIVTAPFTGVVTMRYADVGSLIQAGTASNTQSMPVVKVAQSDLLRLRMQTNIDREDGQHSVYIPVLKQGGNSNTITIVNGVKRAVANLLDIPSVLKTNVVFDQSAFVKIAVKNVINEGTIGLCLTALMILLFLGNVRAT